MALTLVGCRAASSSAVPWVLVDDQLGRAVSDEPADAEASPAEETPRLRSRRVLLDIRLDSEALTRAFGLRRGALCDRRRADASTGSSDAAARRLVLAGRLRWIEPPEGAPPSVFAVSVRSRGGGQAGSITRGDVVVEPGAQAPIALEIPWTLAGRPCLCEASCAPRLELETEWFHSRAGRLEVQWYLVADRPAGRDAVPRALGPDTVRVRVRDLDATEVVQEDAEEVTEEVAEDDAARAVEEEHP